MVDIMCFLLCSASEAAAAVVENSAGGVGGGGGGGGDRQQSVRLRSIGDTPMQSSRLNGCTEKLCPTKIVM